jgi:DNA-directed RNA polymerase specialized sigma subunit
MDVGLMEVIEGTADKTVHKAICELKAAGFLKDVRQIVHKEISGRLRNYYKGAEDPKLEEAIEQLKDDDYFDIIPLYYCTGNTIEHIASGYDVDVSTITRNKKRLCFEIYELMEGLNNGEDGT